MIPVGGRRFDLGILAAPVLALTLTSCATTQTPTVAVAPARPPAPTHPAEASPTTAVPQPPIASAPLAPAAPRGPLVSFAALPGWNEEDHAAALDMFRASCGVEKSAAWREACLRARDLGPQDELISRAFWESNFRVEAAQA